MSRSRPPRLYRFVRDRNAQAEPLGVILVLGLVLVSTTVVVAFGSAAITDVQSRSELDRAENGMTLLDSRLSTVALGDSESQSVDLPTTNGDYTVDPDAGTIRIVHRNYDGTNDATLVPNTSLGAIVYRSNGESIAYQGGGVWRSYEDGSAQMVSPPEFHYREGTLTFPLVRIEGSGGGAGRATITARSTGSGTAVYPDDEIYPNGKTYSNPVENGTVEVIIQSEYAKAWGAYFETRTDGVVTYPSQDTVSIQVISIGTLGDFQMPPETQGITVRGMDSGHSLEDFQFTIRPQDSEESSFSNLDWSLYAQQGQQQFEIHVEDGGDTTCGEYVDLYLFYSDDGGDTHHGWYSGSHLQATCGEINGKPADGDEIWVDVDLTPEDGTNMTYEKVKNEMTHFQSGSKTLAGDANFDDHPADSSHGPYPYADGDTEELTFLTRHYFAQVGPSFDLIVADGNNAGIGESGSSGYIYYGGSGKVVTYLHITKHNVTASVS